MKKYIRIQSLPILIFGILLGFLLTKGILSVYAQVTASIIRACVKSSNGSIRIIDAQSTCDTNETLLEWNQQGIPGATGPSGPQGLVGPTGVTGVGGGSNLGGFRNKDLSNIGFGTGGLQSWGMYRDFSDFNFTNASFDNIYFDYSDFTNANFTGAKFRGGRLNNSIVNGAIFINSDLSYEDLLGIDFSNIDFTGSNLSYAGHIAFVKFTNTNFTNVNMNGASGHPIDTTGAIWSNTTCPDGTNSNSNGNTCDGHFID